MAVPASQAPHGSGLHGQFRARVSFHFTEFVNYAIALVVFVVASLVTLYFNHSMSGGMPMAGGWTMSMMWMPMGGAFASATAFTLMWLAMMVAMMLPSTMPMLLLYRRVAAVRAANSSSGVGETAISKRSRMAGVFTLAVAAGYFFIWTMVGVVAYTIGSLIARGAMRWEVLSRALPLTGGIALCIAGIYQLTPWKSACLTHCRDPLTLVANHLQGGGFGALRLGIHHGAFCAACCWALMLIQLMLGVMNLGVMTAVALVIALEKLLPRGEWVAKATGVCAILGGIFVVVRAV
jgi:predicted metal-binding membrane protein